MSKPVDQKQVERFVEAARELGLDNEESAAAFERVMGEIAKPKKNSEADGRTPSGEKSAEE